MSPEGRQTHAVPLHCFVQELVSLQRKAAATPLTSLLPPRPHPEQLAGQNEGPRDRLLKLLVSRPLAVAPSQAGVPSQWA